MNIRRHTVLATAIASLAALGACSSTTSVKGATTSDVSETVSTAVVETGVVTDPPTTAATATASPVTTVASVPTPAAPAPTTVPPAPPATTVPPAPVCGEGHLPGPGADMVSTVHGDWNGDGTGDVATGWVEHGGSDHWFVNLAVAGGHATTIAVGGVGAGFVMLVDAIDLDFSLGVDVNPQELVAVVGNSSSGFNLGFFGIGSTGCGFQFHDPAGDTYTVPVSGTASAVSGMRCDGGAGSQFAVKLVATTTDGATWATHDVKIVRSDETHLTDGPSIDGTLPVGDPGLAAYGQASCGGAPYVLGE